MLRSQVADAKECSEGVSFFGVRELVIADVPSSANEYIQRVGRAVRFNGHAGLPEDERVVNVKLFVAQLAHEDDADPGKTVDEEQLERLTEDLKLHGEKLCQLQQWAFDNEVRALCDSLLLLPGPALEGWWGSPSMADVDGFGDSRGWSAVGGGARRTCREQR